jgi:hypothetical protein
MFQKFTGFIDKDPTKILLIWSGSEKRFDSICDKRAKLTREEVVSCSRSLVYSRPREDQM